jgi:ParB family chromosome partitioning protein
MDIQKIKIDRIHPNTWNPNHLKKRLYEKLKSYIKAEGAVLPLVLRLHPSKRGCFEIIDGFHRWKIYQELGQAEVNAVVLDIPDEKARILSVNLNYMRGSAKPMEYARLIHDLSEKLTLDDLSLLLPEDKPQLLDKLELLKLPSDLKEDLESKSSENEKETLTTIHFQVTAGEKEIIDAALDKSDKRKKGTALAELVKAGSRVIEGSLTT